MTDKEQIEEMTKILSAYEINELTAEKDLAEFLYNAGYRKEKEVAKEIFQELYDEADGMNNKTVELSAYYIKNTLAKEYGIELE